MTRSRYCHRLFDYARLMRLDRPIGIYLLLWPTLSGLWLASNGHPSTQIVLIFVLGVVVTRSLGCVINDIMDRHIDRHVERTKHRPLAASRIHLAEALLMALLLASLALALIIQLNRLTQLLAASGFVLAVIYPLMKRVVHLPQVVLGVAMGSWPILMAFAAVQNQLPRLAWLAAAAALFWPIAYDTMYALVDQSDDKRIGVKSTARLFGQSVQYWIASFHLLMFLLWGIVGYVAALTWPYYIGLGIAILFARYEHRLIRDFNRERCFQAFLHNNWVGMSLFLGLLIHYTFS